MPVCPTCGKKVALSWQMEKHQQSSRCKLAIKTKEFNRVSEDLRIMCENVEKLQAALIALEKEKQIPPTDIEYRKNMEQIMNKIQEIWDFIKQEKHFSETRAPSSSSVCSTERSPILSETRPIYQPVPENTSSDKIFTMKEELKEYLKQARPSVIKLAESHQVPHLIDLFSRLGNTEIKNINSVHQMPIINKNSTPENQESQTLQQILSKRNSEFEARKDEIVPDISDVYTSTNFGNLSTILTKNEAFQVTPQISSPINVEEKQISESETQNKIVPNVSGVYTSINNSSQNVNLTRNEVFQTFLTPQISLPINVEERQVSESKIHFAKHSSNSSGPRHLSVISSLNEEQPISCLITQPDPAKENIFHDMGTQTITINKKRKPHSAKALGK